ncbi:hypothetical protein [Infirmifilum sp. NZ]|uniref:hypothetical protein n=1 Tax=Infirmifilum sp. NZ TaxID=2926850 RepID=UPI00279DD441|nr:hypothetical protein [Infirmifilum sp. NZ]UNQ73399.1 hypothetical protein MOV14_09845 [Infirmifilum sp. NZ]
MRGALNSFAVRLAELGSTLLFVVAVADFVKSVVVALAVLGMFSLATSLLFGLFGEGAYIIGLALSAGMAVAAVYSLVIAYISKRRLRELNNGTLTVEGKRKMLKIVLPDLAISLLVQNFLSVIGLSLIVLALLIYEPKAMPEL